jgi:MCM P-loop domain
MKIPDKKAEQILKKFQQSAKTIDWRTTSARQIYTIKNEGLVEEPVKLVGHIHTISDPRPIEINGKRSTYIELSIRDRANNQITVLPVYDEVLREMLKESFNHHILCTFHGTVLSVITKETSDYVFYLHGYLPEVTPEDLIEVQYDLQTKRANIFIKQIATQQDKFKYFKNKIVKGLKIKGLNKAKELSHSIDFMIYQAFSSGMYNNNSMKLHSLIIGPPAVGKKLLTLAAKVLNPVSEEIGVVDSKITMPGLIGNASLGKNNTWKSNPGYFTMASEGVLCIQDFHEIKKNRKEIFGALSKLMEDGEVIDSSSARTTFKANTSIHLDMNRKSQVYKGEGSTEFADINIPINILSRFDFIIDIPQDNQRQLVVAQDIITKTKDLDDGWKREVKHFVAYIRTNFNNVKINKDAEVQLKRKLRQIESQVKTIPELKNEFQDFYARLAVSAQKYVKAIARINLRTYAKTSDVDEAFRFIQTKVDFLKNHLIKTNKLTPEPNVITAKDRLRLLEEEFAGKEFRRKEVLALYEKKNIYVNAKTVDRDLMKATKVRQGVYRI